MPGVRKLLLAKAIVKLFAVAVLTIASTGEADGRYLVGARIIDGGSGNEPTVNPLYHIYNATDTVRPIINNVGDLEGLISQELPNPGDYVLSVEYLGLAPERLSFTVNDSAPEVQLGDIVLTPAPDMLQEVVVSVKKPVVVTDGANITYNVSDDPASSTNSVLEMLRKIPMVTVDGEDNIRVGGSSDFKIYLNGRPNPMFSSDPQKILKAMPASAILKIEVLTEPGAKYDAEGAGGILNIIMQGAEQTKNVVQGISGNVHASGSNSNLSAGGYLLAKYRNVTASANLTFADGSIDKRKRTGVTDIEYIGRNGLKNHTESEQPGNDFSWLSGNFNLAWEPSANNLFNAGLTVSNIDATQKANSFNLMSDNDNPVLASWRNCTNADIKRLNWSADASYQHNFNAEGTSLTLSYQYARSNQKLKISQHYFDVVNYPLPEAETLQDMKYFNNEHTAQADFELPITAAQTLSLGVKGVFRDNDSESATEGAADESVDMRQYQDILAAYASYTGTFGISSLTAGLRYEHTHAGIDYRTMGERNFSSNYSDLVPNVSLAFTLGMGKVVRLAYNMRISRPTIEQLNPYVWNSDPLNTHSGNPDLKSQKANNLSLSYSAFSMKASYSLKAEYKFVNNAITGYSEVLGNVINQTYINAGHEQHAGLSGFLNYNFSPTLQAGVNASLEYVDYSLKQENISNHGWPVNLGGNLSWTMPADVRLTAYGGWSTRHYELQGYFSGWHYYGLSVSRNLTKNLEASVSASNFASKYFTFKNHTATKEAITDTRYRMQNWNIGASLTWTFGNLKSGQLKKTKGAIDNDDAVDTGSGKQGGGTGSVL